MQKSLFIIILLTSCNNFPSKTIGLSDVAKFPVLAYFIEKADEVEKPEFKDYIGTSLFGSTWKKDFLPTAQQFAKNSDSSNTQALNTAQGLVILELIEKALKDGKPEIERFICTHQKHHVFKSANSTTH